MTIGSNVLYDGKAKSICAIDGKEDEVLQIFKDTITAFNNPQPHIFDGKGIMSCQISSAIFKFLAENYVKTHLIEVSGLNKQIVEKLRILPIEVTVRNYALGNILKRSHFDKGEKLKSPLIEFMYKNDTFSDPVVSEQYVVEYLLKDDLKLFNEIKKLSLRINELLIKFFDNIDIVLGDFKIEFGMNKNNDLVLGDEISGDTCRLLDKRNNLVPLDKDILRQNLGNVLDGYKEVLSRIRAKY